MKQETIEIIFRSGYLVIIRHLIPASSRYKCLSRRWQNDAIETEAKLRFLLHHSNTSYEGIYASKTLVEVSYFLRK